ncbi:hypothetical protein COCON_G00144180 [Conger conger]|uniref:Uncharacterized protein n=1 Tax=Conger conger TaxID=82655 RepID=A0A9Q1DC87_CONCO|nr:hypothetical protein COCON_G00144180 [Conger conger]
MKRSLDQWKTQEYRTRGRAFQRPVSVPLAPHRNINEGPPLCPGLIEEASPKSAPYGCFQCARADPKHPRNNT